MAVFDNITEDSVDGDGGDGGGGLMVQMVAKWGGKCRLCGVAMPPGTPIDWTKEDGARHVTAEACAAALADPPKELVLRAARPLPPDDFEKLRRLLWAARWRTASSMPSIPHSYTLRKWWSSDEDFRWVIAALRRSGYHQKFGGRVYLYTDIDEFQVFDAAAAGPEETWIDVMELDPRPGREGQYKVAGINRALRKVPKAKKQTALDFDVEVARE